MAGEASSRLARQPMIAATLYALLPVIEIGPSSLRGTRIETRSRVKARIARIHSSDGRRIYIDVIASVVRFLPDGSKRIAGKRIYFLRGQKRALASHQY